MKNTIYHKNYGTEKRNVQLKIDEVFAEKVIPVEDSVRLLDEIIEEMDHTPLFRAYKRTGPPPATNPVAMMKVLVYASMENNFASRGIASACNRDINYIWLLNGEKGILLGMNRSIQAEGAFGVIKQDYGFRQFLLRGKKKILTEILLVAMGYNINKLHNKIQHNRTGRQLFGKLTA